MYKRLDFLQACDEVIIGNIPVGTEPEIVQMVAQSVYVDMEEVPDTREELIEDGCLMEYVPQPWKRDHTDEEWGELVLTAMQQLDGADFNEIQDQFVEKVRPHELFGTCFFHVKRVPYEAGAPEPRLVKGLPDVMYCAFNSDGMHFLSDALGKSYNIIREFGFADIYRWGGSHTRFSLIIWVRSFLLLERVCCCWGEVGCARELTCVFLFGFSVLLFSFLCRTVNCKIPLNCPCIPVKQRTWLR